MKTLCSNGVIEEKDVYKVSISYASSHSFSNMLTFFFFSSFCFIVLLPRF